MFSLKIIFYLSLLFLINSCRNESSQSDLEEALKKAKVEAFKEFPNQIITYTDENNNFYQIRRYGQMAYIYRASARLSLEVDIDIFDLLWTNFSDLQNLEKFRNEGNNIKVKGHKTIRIKNTNELRARASYSIPSYIQETGFTEWFNSLDNIISSYENTINFAAKNPPH